MFKIIYCFVDIANQCTICIGDCYDVIMESDGSSNFNNLKLWAIWTNSVLTGSMLFYMCICWRRQLKRKEKTCALSHWPPLTAPTKHSTCTVPSNQYGIQGQEICSRVLTGEVSLTVTAATCLILSSHDTRRNLVWKKRDVRN
jgi:hypothetical protein